MKRKLSWLPQKKWEDYFLPSSDDEYKRKHPIGYWIIIIFGFLICAISIAIYWVLTPFNTMTIIGLLGAYIIGLGLFNFLAIILDQYLGHLFSILSFLIGALLIYLDCLLLTYL